MSAKPYTFCPVSNPNTETRAAMQDVLEEKNLSSPYSRATDLFAALDAEDTNK